MLDAKMCKLNNLRKKSDRAKITFVVLLRSGVESRSLCALLEKGGCFGGGSSVISGEVHHRIILSRPRNSG